MSNVFIGFPPPLLGEQALRLPVLATRSGLLALAKPAGIGVEVHPLEAGVPAIVPALTEQVRLGKPELESLGIEKPFAVCHLDAEASGVALLACNRESAAHWRNAYGSYQMVFRFLLLSKDSGAEDAFTCELPIAQHRRESRMLVSHKTGKQARTVFKRLQRLGEWSLWEAQCDYLRPHLVRLHAMESGLKIAGETLYSQTLPISLSDLKRCIDERASRKPLYEGLALHLASISVPFEGEAEPVAILSTLPRRFKTMLERLAEVNGTLGKLGTE